MIMYRILTSINEKSNSQPYSLKIKTLLVVSLVVGLFSYQTKQINLTKLIFFKKIVYWGLSELLSMFPPFFFVYYIYII